MLVPALLVAFICALAVGSVALTAADRGPGVTGALYSSRSLAASPTPLFKGPVFVLDGETIEEMDAPLIFLDLSREGFENPLVALQGPSVMLDYEEELYKMQEYGLTSLEVRAPARGTFSLHLRDSSLSRVYPSGEEGVPPYEDLLAWAVLDAGSVGGALVVLSPEVLSPKQPRVVISTGRADLDQPLVEMVSLSGLNGEPEWEEYPLFTLNGEVWTVGAAYAEGLVIDAR